MSLGSRVIRIITKNMRLFAVDLLPDAACRAETPMRLAEILATAAMPEFGNLPLELWPGYRRNCVTSLAPTDEKPAL